MSETRPHDQHCAACDEAEFAAVTYASTHQPSSAPREPQKDCGATGDQFDCTLPIGHDGDHIAHDDEGEMLERWPQGFQGSDRIAKRKREPREPQKDETPCPHVRHAIRCVECGHLLGFGSMKALADPVPREPHAALLAEIDRWESAWMKTKEVECVCADFEAIDHYGGCSNCGGNREAWLLKLARAAVAPVDPPDLKGKA